MKFRSDIDIDFGDRARILSIIKHIPASIDRNGEIVPHNTGVYVTDIPVNPLTGTATLDYKIAEDRGYIKLDFLNVGLYSQLQNEEHLVELMNQEPLWDLLNDNGFCSLLIHVGNHHKTLLEMPEPVNTIPRLAMFLSVIRPAKRHLIGLPWKEVAKTVWEKPADGSYYFKRSHAVAYAHLVVVNMNLICERISYGYA